MTEKIVDWFSSLQQVSTCSRSASLWQDVHVIPSVVEQSNAGRARESTIDMLLTVTCKCWFY